MSTWAWILVTVASLVYLYGFWRICREAYSARLEARYQEHLDCAECAHKMAKYQEGMVDELELCWHHEWQQRSISLWSEPLLQAFSWPLLMTIRWSIKFFSAVFIPRKVTPAQLAWKMRVKEAELERQQRSLEQQQRRLQIDWELMDKLKEFKTKEK